MASIKEEKILEELVKEVRELKELCKTCIDEGQINATKEVNGEEIPEVKVSRVLSNLGVPTNILGYKYTKEAILIIMESKEILKTGYIYELIAQRHDAKYNTVERNIRSVTFHVARVNTDLYKKIFAGKGRVVNSEFIFTIAEYLIMGMI